MIDQELEIGKKYVTNTVTVREINNNSVELIHFDKDIVLVKYMIEGESFHFISNTERFKRDYILEDKKEPLTIEKILTQKRYNIIQGNSSVTLIGMNFRANALIDSQGRTWTNEDLKGWY